MGTGTAAGTGSDQGSEPPAASLQPPAVPSAFALRVPGRVLRVRLVRHNSGEAVDARIAAQAGELVQVEPGALIPGCYDVCVETDEAFSLGLGLAGEAAAPVGVAPPPSAGRGIPPEGAVPHSAPGLSDEQRLALARRVAEIRNYFPVRRVLWVEGSTARAKAVVELRRDVDSTSYRQEAKEAGEWFEFRRLELWFLRYAEPRWVVDRRVFLFRDRSAEGVEHPARLRPELADWRFPDGWPAQPVALERTSARRELAPVEALPAPPADGSREE